MSAQPLPGKFITVEGSEGVGKSTNMAFIEAFLRDRKLSVKVTREPGGTPLAETIRELLLQQRQERVDPTAELLLMFAARAQHLNTVIIPALQQGQWVLCDRFTDSTYAYQGGGRAMDTAVISQLEQLVQGERQPDLTLYLDIDVQQGLARATRRAQLDRFEAEQIDFFERVRACYLDRARYYSQRYRVIDAEPPLAVVQTHIARELTAFVDAVNHSVLVQ